jgi:uracil-DNA glycosylase family 4
LGAARTQAVVYRGSVHPSIVFVGEAPGAEEDRQGVPFVGRSGMLLDRAIGALGERVGPYGVLNVLKCRPPGNRFDRSAAATCRPFLDRQLALLRPQLIVTLGAQALRTLAPDAPPILKCAGAPVATEQGVVFPLVHPAASLRSRRLASRWSDDVTRLGAWLDGRRRETP